MTCTLIDHPHVMPGWGCCACKADPALQGMSVYNGIEREACKRCGHKRCCPMPAAMMPADSKRLSLVERDGEPLAVIRPEDPKKALKLARKAGKSKDPNAFDRVLTQQSYTFMGLLRKDQKIVDPVTLEVLGELKPGDSFVRHSDLQHFSKAEP